MKENNWKPFTCIDLPTFKASDAESIYISKTFLLKEKYTDVFDIAIAKMFISWEGEIEIFFSDWCENYESIELTEDEFNKYLWREI